MPNFLMDCLLAVILNYVDLNLTENSINYFVIVILITYVVSVN